MRTSGTPFASPDCSATFSRGVGDEFQDLPPDKELIMHVIASDLIASDIAAEFDWSSAEADQYLDGLLADDDNDWPGDADE
jgi:hypothetical protein